MTPSLPKLTKLNGAKVKQKRAARTGSEINLKEGVNGIIMGVLADGVPHRYADLKSATVKAGYAGSGIGSRIKRLHETGAVERVSPGLWRATPKEDA